MGGTQSVQNKKLIFLGLDNAGKSSILNVLIGASPYTVSPTRGFCAKTIMYNNNELNVVDIGGQKSLRNQWSNYLIGASGLIWVIDSADRRRMYETGLELSALLQDSNLNGIPILIFANKQDLSTALNASEITEELELHSIRTHNWHIQDCSAIEKTGLDEGMKWIIDEMKK